MRLEAVSKRYGWRQPWVVRDVSLDIEPGRLVRLEGKNGTGKSTLLRMIAGVSAPTKGTVTGRPVTGFVPERFPPGLPFTARDYLLHLGRIQGLDGEALDSPGRGVPGAARRARVRWRADAQHVQGHVPEGRGRAGAAARVGDART